MESETEEMGIFFMSMAQETLEASSSAAPSLPPHVIPICVSTIAVEEEEEEAEKRAASLMAK